MAVDAAAQPGCHLVVQLCGVVAHGMWLVPSWQAGCVVYGVASWFLAEALLLSNCPVSICLPK